MSKSVIVRSSNHLLKHANTNKRLEVKEFIQEYRRVAQLYMDYIWEYGVTLEYQKKGQGVYLKFDADTHLNCVSQLSTVELDKSINLVSFLTSRVKKCVITQVLGVARGTVEKQKKRQYVANLCREQKKKVPKKLRKALRKNKPVRPDVTQINPELNSVCLDYKKDDRKCFDGWLRVKSFTNKERNYSIKLPIREHRHSKLLKSNGKIMSSFLLREDSVDIRWEITPKSNTGTQIVGADPGLNTVLSLSDRQFTPEKDCHGHSLVSIVKKIARKEKGSKAIKKACDHRKNFINWCGNQLDFSNIKELRYERNKNVRKYKSSYHSSSLTHWTYTLINSKVESKCELEEVLLVQESSAYYSQRCSQCGWVQKSNRDGKCFSCKNCDYVDDADFNSSYNHQQELYELPYGFWKLKLNILGFFWKKDRVFNDTGEELAVPLSKNEE